MTALIDADSLVYIIAWNHRESSSEQDVKQSCDNFLRDILTLTGAQDYIGVFSPPSDVTFRAEQYKYAKYKGNRPEKPEFVKLWEPIIKGYYTEKHGFFTDPDLEADDVVAGIFEMLQINCRHKDELPVICSPDKDLRQIFGKHFDYRAKLTEDSPNNPIVIVSPEEAFWNFWTQMLMGDEGDNVAGVPGLGPVKAKKIIDALREEDALMVKPTVMSYYTKYFGGYYGPIIFEETFRTLKLMVSSHPLYPAFANILFQYTSTKVTIPVSSSASGFFDLTS